ncbi:MAG: DUF5698 domain-containing protein [Synergistaceae bacterium]|nr:DUF5698 domain-containing protein [Synergistaceae bacterium]
MGVTGLLGLCMIFFARIIDMSCNTVRILFLVRGRRVIAGCIGFFEVMVYMVVLGYILGGGKTLSFPALIAYCGGFASGNYVGSWLEERLMDTFILAEVFMDDNAEARLSVDAVRGMGLGATVVSGTGRSGPKLVVKIFCRRSDLGTVEKLFMDQGFVTISDVKRCSGGWFPKRL